MSTDVRAGSRWLLLLSLCVGSRCQPGRCDESVPEPVAPGPSFTIASRVLGETRHINVLLPPGYGKSKARFPVLYMPDGGLKEEFPHVTDAVRALEAEGAMRPFIVVGIENTERRRDLTGPTTVDEDRKIAPHVSGSPAFRAFIRDELMPQVRSRYRTSRETAIVGESLAGLFILETFFVEPDLFDTYIAISPSVWWNDESLVRGAGARLQEQPGLHKTLYLASADELNIVPGTARLAATLRADAPAHLTWFYQPMPHEHHNTIYRAAAPQAFRTVFAVTPKAKRHTERMY